MSNWSFAVVFASGCLVLFLLWIEYRRPDNRLLAARLLATVSAVTGMALLMLPGPLKMRSFANRPAVILLSAGFIADSINHFKRTLQTTPEIITLDRQLSSAKKSGAQYFADPREYLASKGQLHVFGHGLSSNEIEKL